MCSELADGQSLSTYCNNVYEVISQCSKLYIYLRAIINSAETGKSPVKLSPHELIKVCTHH